MVKLKIQKAYLVAKKQYMTDVPARTQNSKNHTYHKLQIVHESESTSGALKWIKDNHFDHRYMTIIPTFNVIEE